MKKSYIFREITVHMYTVASIFPKHLPQEVLKVLYAGVLFHSFQIPQESKLIQNSPIEQQLSPDPFIDRFFFM